MALHVTAAGQIIAGSIIVGLAVPMILGKVPPNRIYGIRTRTTLGNREAWYAVNRFAGKLLVGVGVLAMGLGVYGLSLQESAWREADNNSMAVIIAALVAVLLATRFKGRKFANVGESKSGKSGTTSWKL